MVKIIHPVVFQKGKVLFKDKNRFDLYVGQFRDGTEGELTVSKKRRKRTSGQPDEEGNQNAYYWAVVLPIAAQGLGYQPYEVDLLHEVFLEEFAPYIFKNFAGKQVRVKIRSSDMNTVQFTEYVEAIRIKMAEMGVVIPDPEKVTE